MVWEDGEDSLIGESGGIWFDGEIEIEGGTTCFGGLSQGLGNPGSILQCQGSWRFFNLNGAGEWKGEY